MANSDYLVLGGGLAGCVVATRIKEYFPSASVTLVEGGPNAHGNPLIVEPMATFQLHQSVHEYNYKTVPQKAYDGRQVFNAGGKMLSGSTCCNYAMWIRGDAADYDTWAEIVGDERWSYKGLLPYFKKTEHHFDSNGDPAVHGFEGPIHTAPIDREYPLKKPLQEAYEYVGVKANPDGNSGAPNGYGGYIENWRDGKRQPAGKAYGIKGVEIITGSYVKRIIVEKDSSGTANATGAELVDGRILTANREVILSCGAIRSPQVLLLSGIGPADELLKHNIPQVVDSPEVGKNFFDHASMAQFFQVRNPEEGLCAGSAAFHERDPKYSRGMPVDFVALEHLPRDELANALKKDGHGEDHPLLRRPRNPIETVCFYAPAEAPLTDLNVPFDGTCVTMGALNMLPTSRGSVTLASTDPTDDPLIDPNYYSTEADKFIFRSAMRRGMSLIEAPSMSAIFESEFTPKGFPPLTSNSTDDELDARIKRCAATWFHFAGSCAMGKVVDTDLRLKGVSGLRVVDASVYPTPFAAHLQCPTYALAEQAADIICGKQTNGVA